MEKIDFDALIINERNKIWEDKLKLTEQNKSSDFPLHPVTGGDLDGKVDPFINNAAGNSENISPNQNFIQTPSPRCHVGALSEHNPFSYVMSGNESVVRNTHHLSRPNRINLSSTKASTEPRMATMVRFGEYSPLNPNLLSPGKSLLGLGEYEEKRRQLMNRKKQEYREYLAQARQFGSKSSTPTKPNEVTKQKNLFFNSEKDNVMPDYIPNSNKHLATSTNTTLTKPVEYVKLSNILSDSRANTYSQNDSPYFNGNFPLLLTSASTNSTIEKVTRGVQTELEWNYGTIGQHLTETNQTMTHPEEKNPYTQNDSPYFNGNFPLLLRSASTNAAPEKVTRDVQTEPEWNYRPIGQHFNQTLTSPEEKVWPNVPTSTCLRNRGATRNHVSLDVSTQAVEKSRGLENAKRHVVANEPVKFMSPRERKLADLQESGQRSSGFDTSESSLQDDVSPTALKTHRETYKEELRKQIEEKQRLNLELREKEKLEEEMIARRTLQQQERMRQEFLREEAERKMRQVQRCSQTKDFRQESARYLRTKSSGKVPPEEQIVGGSGISPREEAQSSKGSPSPETALTPQNQDRRQAEASVREPCGTPYAGASFTRNKGKKINLDDSLPIPVFRAHSPIVPALRTTVEMGQERASANSKEMQMLEAKWQVPAVQKTNLTPTVGFLGDSSKGCPKTILTQLGAFRRQLQIEQMRMEEIVQQRNHPNLI